MGMVVAWVRAMRAHLRLGPFGERLFLSTDMTDRQVTLTRIPPMIIPDPIQMKYVK